MFHFPDPDTGYYDPEERFYALDAEHEAAEERAYLEELEASCDGGDREMEPTTRPTSLPGSPQYQPVPADVACYLFPGKAIYETIDETSGPLGDIVDPETGCTAAEMKEDRMPICTDAHSDAAGCEGKVA
jgi:hypothetical protein